jgi:hypothetical protein
MKAKKNTTLSRINEVKLVLLRLFVFFGDYYTMMLYKNSVNPDRLIVFREDLKCVVSIFNEMIKEIDDEIA